MKTRNKKWKWIVPLGVLVAMLSLTGVAFAATNAAPSTTIDAVPLAATAVPAARTVTTNSPSPGPYPGRGWGWQHCSETPLTGEVLAKVKAAVLAKIGSDARLLWARVDADGHDKYEAHAAKADGTRVIVHVDESFKVVSVEDCVRSSQGRRGPGRDPGGRMGPRHTGETALSGDALAKVKEAALAAAGSGSTLMRATVDGDGIANYEAHVRKADGTCLIVYLDDAYKVVKTETAPLGDMQRRGWGGRGQGGCMRGSSTPAGTI